MSNSAHTNEILSQVQDAVRAGHGESAARMLTKMNTARVARQDRLPLAVAARRCGLFAWGLRLLGPLVYPERNRWQTRATPAETAEYAVLLQKAGGTKEALGLLNKVNASEVPDAALFRAFCHFSMWDYQAGLPELEIYLRSNLPDYARLVGQVNLASALVILERTDEALELIAGISAQAASEGHARLLANARELRAQAFLQNGDWAAAEHELSEAEKAFGTDTTHDQLFVQKWKAILSGLRTGNSAPIEAFRRSALERRHWESVREADLYSLKINFDLSKFNHLIAGTPFPAYRARILNRLGITDLPEAYLLGDPSGVRMDLASGVMSDGQSLNVGGKIHRLYSVLLSDLYRPLKLAGLFSELFPGEYFDINTSPDRVHQLLRRARQWSASARYGELIREHEGDYRFVVTEGFSVLIPVSAVEIDKNNLVLGKLKSWAPPRRFTALEARRELGMSATTFGRFAAWAVENGHLQKLGAGPRTAYAINRAEPAPLRAVGS